ncbi:MAG: PqqD family protein [Reyranellaceae bacterium]
MTALIPLSTTGSSLPFPTDVLKRLAISETGFVFDPVSGDSFTANATALAILRLAGQATDTHGLAEALAGEFDVDVAVAERDLIEFAGVLRRTLG